MPRIMEYLLPSGLLVVTTPTHSHHLYKPIHSRSYEPQSNSKKETAKNILEVGIHNGGSIKLCTDYFINANIYGLDIMNIDQIADDI